MFTSAAAPARREIFAAMYEDEPYDEKQQNLMQTYTYNAFAVNPDVLDCDYYRFCGLDSGAVNAYQNEYMSQYYWADFFVRRRFLIL